MATVTDRYNVEINVRNAQTSLGGLAGSLRGLGPLIAGAFAAKAVVDFGTKIVDTAAKFEKYRNQLSLVTKNSEDLANTMNTLALAASRNRASFEATVELYVKLRLATESMGKSTESVLAVVGKFQQALAVSGADANTASAAIRQFGQAMASGTVRGDEFTSIVEALGPAIAIMARESGLSVGKLREMSQAGDLSSEAFYKLIENSESLKVSFQAMTPTIDDLNTRLGDAFDRAIQSSEAAGTAIKIYRGLLQDTARALDKFAGTEGALPNIDVSQVMTQAKDGTVAISDALAEINSRINETYVGLQGITAFLFTTDERAQLVAYREELTKLLEVKKAADEANKAEAQRLQDIVAPYKDVIDRVSAYGEAVEKNLTVEEKRTATLEAQRSELTILKEDLARLIELRAKDVDGMTDAAGAVETLTQRQTQLIASIAELEANTGLSEFDRYYKQLMETATKSITEFDFSTQAAERLKMELASGAISAAQFDEAMVRISSSLQQTYNDATALTAQLNAFKESAANRVQSDADSALLAGLTGQEKALKAIELQERRTLESSIARIRASGGDPAAIEAQVKAYEELTRTTILQRQEQSRLLTTNTTIAERATKTAEEAAKRAQQTFANGWTKAFETYRDEARDASKLAESLFGKTTQGMEDLLVDFTKTGKFEWKGFVADITETLLRSQIKNLIADIFGGGQQAGSATGGSTGGGILGTLGNLLGLGSGSTAQSGVSQSGVDVGSLLGGTGAMGSRSNPLYVVPVNGGGLGSPMVGDGVPSIDRTPQIAALNKQFSDAKMNGGFFTFPYKEKAEQIRNSALQPSLANFGQNLVSQIGNSLFGGFFATGGQIPAGRFGIVGERGAELVQGPASVTPMGNSQVTYNINAVDARSFKELVAADPGFIHAVATAGGNQVPRRRR